ncbi:MAG: hypothetical protein GY777_02465 [Candidatus Brocadiaceae bacterium]|nr:hypothetical protein [Candidatus Brocadiaceae bacterium]
MSLYNILSYVVISLGFLFACFAVCLAYRIQRKGDKEQKGGSKRIILIEIYAFMMFSIILCIISFYLDKGEIHVPENLITNVIGNENLLKNGGFEQDLGHWGTGYFEANKYGGRTRAFYLSEKWIIEDGAWKLKITNASGSVVSGISKFGKKSFKIDMNSDQETQIFATMSQRIDGLTKNAKYIISFWAKTENARRMTFEITTRKSWGPIVQIEEGTYDWREYTHIINIGNNSSVDFRILSVDRGTVWVDGISFKRHYPDDVQN